MKKRIGFSERTSDIILVVITAVVLLIVAYPLYYVLIASVSDPYDVYAGKTFLFPAASRWTDIWRFFRTPTSSPDFSTR
ncbi:hypothetical protein [Pseudoflavonifractor phocaeensis]|uniref:hypothetical protein n=1 Tax=Pseudoflavonifractor phocaeensis TaxID=1870988 RepID=UPI001FB04972|nr:hypothetical protein [Pseudoflavonifractor phocaeensis]